MMGSLKEFYQCFWDEIKKPFLASIHKAFLKCRKKTQRQKIP